MSLERNQVINEFNQQVKPVSLWADAWKRLRRNKMALIGLWIVAVFAVLTLMAPMLPIYSNTEQEMKHINLPPSFKNAGQVALETLQRKANQINAMIANEGRDDLKPELEKVMAEYELIKAEINVNPVHKRVYLMGTDYLGRDMLSRTIYGGRISMLIGFIGTITAVFIGIIIGAIAGYIGGRLDDFLMRFVDIMYGLPYMLVVIILMAMFRKEGQSSVIILFVAIAMVSWLTIARVVRGQIISLKNAEFVEAARSMGASSARIIFRHLLPNTLGVIIVFSTLSLPGFIMSESFLSFLGLGVSAPDASWGTLVSEGVQSMELFPWRLLVPACVMTIFLFAMNFLGDGLRDALDPQSKNRA
ncbi:MAG: ABC transporter permease [Spirochaetes bacterium]|nr:ABC transporter permease [Spirochaetota bacterium]